MSEFSDMHGGGGGHGTGFRRVLHRLLGETVRVHTNHSSFSGRLADVATCYLTLATVSGSGGSRPNIVYIPVRHINAVTDK